MRVIDDTFWGRYHLPPLELGAPGVVVDLGSNIGLTMSHFAHLFPGCPYRRVSNSTARTPYSVAGTSQRGAIAARSCRRRYRWTTARSYTTASTTRPGLTGSMFEGRRSEPVTVEGEDAGHKCSTSLVPNETVDFLKVDIEGAEQNLLHGRREVGRAGPRC